MTTDYVPAGWLPDPITAGQERWWDGLGWTSFERSVEPSSAAVIAHPVFEAPVVAPSRWGSISVWLLAASPWYPVLPAAVALGIYELVGIAASKPFPVLMVFFIFSLVPVLWAARDRDVLLSYGHAKAPRWEWVLLTPLAYLIARTVQLRFARSRGASPLWLHIVLIVINPTPFIVVSGLLFIRW